MNATEEKYNKFDLVKEMMETPDIIRKFDPECTLPYAKAVSSQRGLFLTGEGSSRLFPAKRAIYDSLKREFTFPVFTEGATQAVEYNLRDLAVFVASNSGQTKEVIRLVAALKKQKHPLVFGLTANQNTRLEEYASATHHLTCGKENAVAATKSVIEQGLFYDSLLCNLRGERINGLESFAGELKQVLTIEINQEITQKLSEADVIYFAGKNNGVGEELALKTNEITRKKSHFLEGTFALHGIEEVMNKTDVLIWIDPFEGEESMFYDCFINRIGMSIIAISSKSTIFPTIQIPEDVKYAEYLQLAAGWNLLAETGIALGIDLDKPVRARKVGNEYIDELKNVADSSS
jgi:glucosamine--fructose-6-phosphate aminotransferase (isomerizing)